MYRGLKPPMGIYRAPEEYKYLNYGERPIGAVIDTIVIHYTVADFHTSYALLTADRGVSAHYLIREDGRIDNLVSEHHKAWHAGVSSWHGRESVNDFSIGIELVNPGSGDQECFLANCERKYDVSCEVNPFPQSQMDALIHLIFYLKFANKDIKNYNIIGHSDVTAYEGRKIDPGASFDWHYLAYRGHGIFSNLSSSAPQVLYHIGTEGVGVKDLQHRLKLFGYNITESGYYDEHTANVVRAFNLHFNHQNGYCWGTWDDTADLRLNDMLGKYYEYSPNDEL